MAITDKEEGVWELDQVYNKINQGGIWGYTSAAGGLYVAGGDPWTSGVPGQNNQTSYSSPIQIPGQWALEDSIFAGDNKLSIFEQNAMAIKDDGTLWGWGANNKGKYAQNNQTQYSSPVQIPGTTWNVLSLAGTNSEGGHCIKTDGTLWAWGDNDNGQLGLNNKTEYSSPVQVPGTTWKATVTDGHKFMALKTDGTLWTCGYGGDGQLAHDNNSNYSSPKQVPGTTWGNSFGCGDSTAVATKTDGTIWTWGKNNYGQGGQNNQTTYSSPKQVGSDNTWSKVTQGTQNSTLAVKTNGTLWGWGSGTYGQLGQNDRTSRSSPVQIPGTTWDNVDGSFTNIIAHKTDGTLWAWGKGTSGQLGQNNTTTRSSPVQIPGTWENTIDGGGYVQGALKKV
jgi:alpha-tubulin suppressor-like RCC1 family protein